MDSDICGTELYQSFNRSYEIIPRFIRKACDEIHVDDVKSSLGRLLVSPDHVSNRMAASELLQSLIPHRLRIYADPPYPVRTHRIEF